MNTLTYNLRTQKGVVLKTPKIQQLRLLAIPDTELVRERIPPHPLIAKLDTSAYIYWHCDRYRISCAHTGQPLGFPFYRHEVDYILSQFEGWRSPVTQIEFGAVAEKAVKQPKLQQAVGVAA